MPIVQELIVSCHSVASNSEGDGTDAGREVVEWSTWEVLRRQVKDVVKILI